MISRPLVPIVSAFAAGIAAAVIWPVYPPVMLLLTILSGAVLLLALYRYQRWLLPLALVFFMLFGWFWSLVDWRGDRSGLINLAGQQVQVEGYVSGELRHDQQRAVYALRLTRLQVGQRVYNAQESVMLRILAPSGFAVARPYRYGDWLKVDGLVELPATPGNPGDFDYQSYLSRQGIGVEIRAVYPEQVIVTGRGGGYRVIHWAMLWRGRVVDFLETVLPAREAALLSGIIFGERRGISDQDSELFQITGVSHILAVSGANVAFVLLLAWGGGLLLRLPEKLNLAITAIAVIAYGVVTGLAPSVLRAVIMALVGLLAYGWGQKRDIYSSLMLAAGIMLFYAPQYLQDPGFQLSFLATWGLVYLTPAVEKRLGWLPHWRTPVAAALAAELATLPLVAYYFNLVSVVGIIANLLIAATVGVMMTIGLVAAPMVFIFKTGATALFLAEGFIARLVLLLLAWLGSLPGAAFYTPSLPLAVIFGYYLLLVAWRESDPAGFLDHKWSQPWLRPILATLFILLLLVPWASGLTGDRMRVDFIDVGQGDAILIRLPGRHNLLVDAGGLPHQRATFDVGSKIVVPYLRRQGVRELDAVIYTHPHDDHVGGLAAVVKALPVKHIFGPPYGRKSAEMIPLRAAAQTRRLNIESLDRGDKLRLGPVLVEVLHPGPELSATHSDPNNNSLVLRLNYGRIKFLLTGDIEMEAMADLLQSGQDWSATVFKVPHHGSRYSLNEAFLARGGRPLLVVISVGRKNSFGHPAPEIITYWADRRVPVLRTDRDGAVQLSTDGRDLRVKTFRPQKLFTAKEYSRTAGFQP